ncbi:hypothetical protein CPAR01_09101 [Colletotrichum paranaense]|uniref:Uncharacterized protein n=5 Tax=Colletotrichum acutatum species complex TaxID=2707335 RepID=A0A9Q8SIC1_9PEZI|nr:uncharacterized protein CLUP02_03387 [Colletotrichum lupini]XP_060347497.1 uncharacterized protein CPAR01_09101 [Colletotrichum paranaense]KAI3533371.1 hypothetical protein CSPX01_12756 [Colletotrichum filicis]KAK1457096.1 hypothetical protein CMEL01_16107 [Colletotrichum melonis]KAK1464487.1 hypothetical protein CCUS01_08061 [Colletotrichum cuscutae]KAK1535559.1 hypothetical protein CPAR01_09101 [Colletotrichum paranaense]UQC77914.1 hypothetical protein CLUP02_03387 [Colletotrichum lupini
MAPWPRRVGSRTRKNKIDRRARTDYQGKLPETAGQPEFTTRAHCFFCRRSLRRTTVEREQDHQVTPNRRQPQRGEQQYS